MRQLHTDQIRRLGGHLLRIHAAGEIHDVRAVLGAPRRERLAGSAVQRLFVDDARMGARVQQRIDFCLAQFASPAEARRRIDARRVVLIPEVFEARIAGSVAKALVRERDAVVDDGDDRRVGRAGG